MIISNYVIFVFIVCIIGFNGCIFSILFSYYLIKKYENKIKKLKQKKINKIKENKKND